MKRIFLFLVVILAGLSHKVSAQLPDEAKECYLFSVYLTGDKYYNTPETVRILYNTATQTNLVMPKTFVYGKGWLYYLKVTENPVSFTITPNEGYGITSAKCQVPSINYKVTPDGFTVYASDMPVDTSVPYYNPVEVRTTEMSNIRTGTLVINADKPEGLNIQNRTGNVMRLYTGDDFVNGRLEILYSPETEKGWSLTREDGKEIFKTSLDDEALTRSSVVFYKTLNQGVVRPAFILNLEEGTHTVNVVRDHTDIDIPLRIRVENNGNGNETVQSILNEKIKKVNVENVGVVDRAVWDSETFTVKNGSTVALTLAETDWGMWEVNRRSLNGEKVTGNTFFIEGDDATPQEIVITGLVNSPFRYNIKAENYDKFRIRVSNSDVEMTSPEYSGAQSFFSGMTYNVDVYTRTATGYKVQGVKLNGTAIEPDQYGDFHFNVDTQDAVIEVDCKEYVRNLTMPVKIGKEKYNSITFVLDPNGPMEERVVLTEDTDIKYNADDLPIAIENASQYVYVNGTMQKKNDAGYFLEDYMPGQTVRVYTTGGNPITVTYKEFPAGVNATITHDGVAVQPNASYVVAPYTKVKVTPTSGSNLVLEGNGGRLIEKNEDGSYYVDLSFYSEELWLHPENPYVNIVCSEGKLVVTDLGSERVLFMSKSSERFNLPYTGQSNDTYTFKVSDPEMIYSIKNVSSTPSGAVFNKDNYTISGLKGGMTLNIELSKKDKPYEYSFTAIPGCNYITEDSGYGHLIYYEADDNGDYVYENGMKKQLMLQWSVAWGQDNPEYGGGGYAIPIQYGVTSSLALGEGNGLSAEDFPVNIMCNISSDETLNKFPYTFFINGKVYDENSVNFNDVIDKGYDQWSGTHRYMYQIVIEEPQSIDAKFYLTNLEKGTAKLTSDIDFSYSISGGNRVEMKADESKIVDIYPGQVMTFYAAEGETISLMKVKDANDQTIQNYSKPEEGVWTWRAPSMDKFTSRRSYEVTLEGERMTMTVKIDDAKAQLLINGGRKGTNDVWTLKKSNSIVVTSASGYRIIEATDGNGNPLILDVASGTVFGVENGMTINLKTEVYTRNRNLIFITSDSKNTKIKLAPSTTKEMEVSLGTSTSEVRKQIPYHSDDWPFYVNVGTNAALYLNNSRISYNAEADMFNFPSEIPDGSVIRVVPMGTSQKTSVSATVEVDEDLKVNMIIDGRVYDVAEGKSTKALPANSTVQIEAKADNKYNFTASASYRTTIPLEFAFEKPSSVLRVGVGMDKLTISIEKDYHKLTLNAAEGVDMSNVSVVADDAVCEVVDGNMVNIPTHISKATIKLTEADKYIAGVTSDVEGMSFDAKTGELTGLATATLTLDVQPVIRDKSMNVYVSSDELSGGSMVLGARTVVSKEVAVSTGFNDVNYGGLDVPVIYQPVLSMNESGVGYDTSSLPIVYVNGEKLNYDETLNGFVIGEDVLTAEVAPIVKIYPEWEADENGEVQPVHVNYIVENGISFKAVEDNVVEVTEVAQRRLLPGTKIEFTAESETSDPIYVEVDGERVEPVEGVYSFVVENEDLTISVLHQKIQITVNAEDWQNMRVSGGGLDYPLYDEVSSLYFPLSTTEVVIVSHVEGKIVTAVTTADGSELDYDMVTGVLKGITGNMVVNVVLGDYLRASNLHIYLEETGAEQMFLSELVLGEGTTVEKSLALSEGYNTIQIGALDMPLAFRCVEEVGTPVVYLNDEMLNYNGEDGLFEFPDELPEVAVLKVFASAQPVISLNYEVELEDYELNVVHDRVVNIEKPGNHSVLPGTEIRITLTSKRSAEADSYFKPMAEEDDDELKVKVNDELLTPEADGSYVVKVKAEHADNGLSISIKEPIKTSALMEVFADGKPVDIYTVSGVLIKKSANPDDVKKLVPGVYIMAGKKVMIR